jgi:aldose 1-epimerase
MDVSTDCPGIQLYTANYVDGEKGKDGQVYGKRSAFCLETQYFPNSVNEPNFVSPMTDAGEVYESKTVYAFSAENA